MKPLTTDCLSQPLAVPFLNKQTLGLSISLIGIAATALAGSANAEMYPGQQRVTETALAVFRANPQLNDPAIYDLKAYEQLMAVMRDSRHNTQQAKGVQ